MAGFKVTQEDASWVRFDSSRIFLGEVVDESNSTSMGVGYARYDGGESNDWTLTYDEALIVLSGSFSVAFGDGEVSAGPGEIIWIEAGTSVVYKAHEDTVLVYVSYPMWRSTEGTKSNAALLNPLNSPTP